MKLLITEKPSQGEALADAFGLGSEEEVVDIKLRRKDKTTGKTRTVIHNESTTFYRGEYHGEDMMVISARGHIIEYRGKAPNNAPLLESIVGDFHKWRAPTKRDKGRYAAFVLMKKYFKESDEIIGATDNDEEGELIFYNLVKHFKPKCDVSRMVYISLTPRALRVAYENRGEIRENIARASDLRTWLDRTYGYVYPKYLTQSYKIVTQSDRYTPFPVGRVMTPATNFLIQKAKVIERAKESRKTKKPEIVADFTLKADLPNESKSRITVYIPGEQYDISLERALELKNLYDKFKGTLLSVQKIKYAEEAIPSGLTIDDIREWAYKEGIDYTRTDQILQAMYGVEKLISYPRSESRILPEDAEYHAPILPNCIRYLGLEDVDDLIVRDVPIMGEENDGAHYGIHPTEICPGELPKDYKLIYEFIVRDYIRGFCRDKIAWAYEYEAEFVFPLEVMEFNKRCSVNYHGIFDAIEENNEKDTIRELLIEKGYGDDDLGYVLSIRKIQNAEDLRWLIDNCDLGKKYIGYRENTIKDEIYWETVDDYGYMIAENPAYKNFEPEDDIEELIPVLYEGDDVETFTDVKKKIKLPEIPDKPTKQDLFKFMREKGLGTDATRSSILQKLWDADLVKGDPPFATILGNRIHDAVDDLFPLLNEVDLTTKLNELMEKVKGGERDPEDIKRELKTEMRENIANRLDDIEEIGNKLVYFGKCKDCNAPMQLIAILKNGNTNFFLGCSERCGHTASI